MTQQTLNNNETGKVIRDKINENFDEAYGGIVNNKVVPDEGTVGSETAPNAITISSNGDVKLAKDLILISGKLIGTPGNLDLIKINDDSLVIDGEIDLSGNYILQLQNIIDLAAKGAGYWFDGVDDLIQFSITTELGDHYGSVYQKIRINNLVDNKTLWGLGNTGDNNEFIYCKILANGTISLVTFNGANYASATGVISEGVIYDIVWVKDGSSDPTLWINGKLVAVTGSGDEWFDDYTINNMAIAALERTTVIQNIECEIFITRFYTNVLTATEIKALSSGAPVPYKYIGASETEMIPDSDNTDFEDGTINEWVVVNGGGGNGTCVYDAGPGAEKTAKITVGGTPGTDTQASLPSTSITTLVARKLYRLKADVYIPSGNNNWTNIDIRTSGFASAILDVITAANLATEDTWQTIVSTIIFDATDLVGDIRIKGVSTTTGDIFYLDNISIIQIGCVLQLEQPGIGHNQWIDISGNELHGAVSGALPTNLPANHIERYVKKAVTGETTITAPTGYAFVGIAWENTTANQAGNVNFGWSDDGQEIVADVNLAGNTIGTLTLLQRVAVLTPGSMDNAYISSDDWNGASIDFYITFERLV